MIRVVQSRRAKRCPPDDGLVVKIPPAYILGMRRQMCVAESKSFAVVECDSGRNRAFIREQPAETAAGT